jgi:hypothetical protein
MTRSRRDLRAARRAMAALVQPVTAGLGRLVSGATAPRDAAASGQPRARLCIYACPGQQRGPLARLLAGYGLAPESESAQPPAGQLGRPARYACGDAAAGLASELAGHIILSCPGVSFAAWDEPAAGSPGDFHAYTPAAGYHRGPCVQADLTALALAGVGGPERDGQ